MEPLVPILFEGQQFYSHTHTHIIIMLYALNLYNAVAAAKSLQSCPTLCDSIGGSLPGSPVPGTLQARILEWVAISFSKASQYIWEKVTCFNNSGEFQLSTSVLPE